MDNTSDGSAPSGSQAGRLFVLLSGGALAGMVQMAIVPSLPKMAEHFSDQGDGAFIAQLVNTVAAPTLAFGAPLIGWIAGRVGKRPVLLLSALVYALAGLGGAFAPDLWSLMASRLLLGLASAGLGTTAMAFIADYYAGNFRDRLIGWYNVVGAGGTLISLLIAGFVVEFAGWRAPFGLYLVGALIFLVALPAIKERHAASTAAAAGGGSLRGAYGLFALTVALSVVMNMVAVQGIFLLDSEGVHNSAIQSAVIDMTTIGSMIGAYSFGYIRPKLGFRLVLALNWAVLAVGVLGFAYSTNIVALSAFAGLVGTGAGLMLPLTQSAILNVVPPEASARAMGMSIGAIFLGFMINPFIVKPLRAAFGFQGAFVWMGGAAVAGLALTLLWRMRSGVRAAPASS